MLGHMHLRLHSEHHAMAILREHKAKSTKIHEGSTNLRLTQELRSVTDLTLWVTEVTARSLWKAWTACGPRVPSMAQPC